MRGVLGFLRPCLFVLGSHTAAQGQSRALGALSDLAVGQGPWVSSKGSHRLGQLQNCCYSAHLKGAAQMPVVLQSLTVRRGTGLHGLWSPLLRCCDMK